MKRSIGAVRQRPKTPRNWRCSFAFFESFLRHFNKKQRAEVIFRLSRPVSCKNQKNGSVSDAGLDLTGSVQGLYSDSHARPIESDLVRKRPQNILTSVCTGAGWIFEDFLSFDFFSVLNFSLFFFVDHADCGTCFTLAKNGIVIVTRHSASESSDENAHTEVQHLPSAAFLDRFLRSRPSQLPKLKETFLHGHSILHDRLLTKEKKMTSRRYRHGLANEIF